MKVKDFIIEPENNITLFCVTTDKLCFQIISISSMKRAVRKWGLYTEITKSYPIKYELQVTVV